MSPPRVDVALARIGVYRLFSRLALTELDASFVAALRALPILGAALDESGGAEALPALRAEYARTFLMNVFPYESVYLDTSGMLSTERSASVLEHYREHGFDPPELRSVGASDHLGLELAFVADLLGREAAAHRAGRLAVARALVAEQQHFLEAHLLRWAPLFGLALSDLARLPFYDVYGHALAAFLLGDYEGLNLADAPISHGN